MTGIEKLVVFLIVVLIGGGMLYRTIMFLLKCFPVIMDAIIGTGVDSQ
jgi:hypothetical protein